MGYLEKIINKNGIHLKMFHGIPGFSTWKWQCITFFSSNGYNRAHQFQAFIAISIHSTSCTLHPGAWLEIYGVQCDHLGWCKEGVRVNFSHGAGHTIRPSRCTDQPSISSQSVIDVLTCTNRACFVIVWIFRVASLWKTNTVTVRVTI